jgi:hypothetical protein
MRIGELNKILDEAVSDSGQLTLKATATYAGQAYKIDNIYEIYSAVSALEKTKLLPSEPNAIVKQILDENENTTAEEYIEIDNAKYNELNSYIQSLNGKLPAIKKVVATFSPEQDEQVINVKLPNNITTLEDLNKINKRLDTLFKKFNITGEVKLIGFDVGSEWYQFLVDGAPLFSFIVATIDLALRIVDFKKKKTESSETPAEVKVINEINGSNNTITQNVYVNKLADDKIEAGVGKTIENIGVPDNRAQAEFNTMLVNATKELIKELGKGTEFHLSLNPPEYLEESKQFAGLKIDYSSMPQIENAEEGEPRQLTDGEAEAESTTDDEN